MTRSEQIAHHRAELARLEAEEKAARPALAAGQVWRHIKGEHPGLLTIGSPVPGELRGRLGVDAVGLADGIVYADLKEGHSDSYEYVGLARDVLRVVDPEAVAQPEPEPTGAELVGKRCEFWNTKDDHYHLVGECIEVGDGCGYRVSGGIWTMFAKLYREGVAP